MNTFEDLLADMGRLKELPVSLLADEERYTDQEHPFFGLGMEERQELLHRVLCVTSDEEFAEEAYLLDIGGTRCLSRGDIAMIKADAKKGKTQAAVAICAALLKGELWQMKSLLTEEAKVMFFDTEQAPRDTLAIYKRILAMAGMDETTAGDRLSVLTLRKLTISQRIAAIKYAIMRHKPHLAVIDGAVDLVENFNENTETSKLVGELMKWSSEANCLIITVIHTNPSDQLGKGRGHLGTILQQKASDVLQLTASGGIFTVSPHMSRHIPMPTWSFRFTKDGLLESADGLPATKEDRQQEVAGFITQLLQEAEGNVLARSHIHERVKERFGCKDTAADSRINEVRHLFDWDKVSGKDWMMLKKEEEAVCLFIFSPTVRGL